MSTTNADTAQISETFDFNADIAQLMHLIIHTFYSNKDVFLRELISNSSDALTKLRHAHLLNKPSESIEYAIKIFPDVATKTLTISDNGVGMSKEELTTNLGTIAKSGTKAFIDALTQKNDQLIGKFGVGFYSSFLVGDKIDVISQSSTDEQAWKWSSDGKNSFSIEKHNRDAQGTDIIIYLKDEEAQYLEKSKLKTLISTYSEFVDYPIFLNVEREVEVEESKDDVEDDDDKPQIEEVMETKKEMIQELEHINTCKPIWQRPASEVAHDDYQGFYKIQCNDTNPPLAYTHFSTEGTLCFTALMFIPLQPPTDFFTESLDEATGLKLYVRRVFITDLCNEMIPQYLKFMKGVVDSNDLPLNISREILQESKVLKSIKKHLVKKCLALFEQISVDDPEKYMKFYETYYKSLKLGVHTDDTNRDRIVKLLRYTTSKGEFVSFDAYVDRMEESDKNIYYICGENMQSVQTSPFISKCLEDGKEVIFMTDTIDEYVVKSIGSFREKSLVCLTQMAVGEVDEEVKKSFIPLTVYLKTKFDQEVEKVVISDRVSKGVPWLLSTNNYGWTANMQRIMAAQVLHDDKMAHFLKGKKIIEINPNHPLNHFLLQRLSASEDVDSIATVIYQTSMLSSGFTVSDASAYANMIFEHLTPNDIKIPESLASPKTSSQVPETPNDSKISQTPSEVPETLNEIKIPETPETLVTPKNLNEITEEIKLCH
jgi:molecular chaperone HtpG